MGVPPQWFDRPMPTTGTWNLAEWEWYCYRNRPAGPVDDDQREAARVWAAAMAGVPPLAADAPRAPRKARPPRPPKPPARTCAPLPGDRERLAAAGRQKAAWKGKGLTPEERRRLIAGR